MRSMLLVNQISAKDLNCMSKMRQTRHREIYTIILERIYLRIRRCSSVAMTSCLYDVPEIVFGYPLFDVEKCICFVIHHLVMNGYDVSRSIGSPHILDITWVKLEKVTPPADSMRMTNGGSEGGSRIFMAPNDYTRMNNGSTHSPMLGGDHFMSIQKRSQDNRKGHDGVRSIKTFVTHSIVPRICPS